MSTKYILGNWKMHCTQAEAMALAGQIAATTLPAHVKVAVFPPFTALSAVREAIKGSALGLGAQDVSQHTHGAFTGDISASMLKDAGCAYVLIGHSERRALHGETSAQVKDKARAAAAAGLICVLCVGESLQERESGSFLDSITHQLRQSLPTSAPPGRLIIAYEPVWAIGTGKTPTTAQIVEVHKTIASLLSYATSEARVAEARAAIVYGGSVKAASAGEILALEGVDGVLVGGASLKADEFGAIIAAGMR